MFLPMSATVSLWSWEPQTKSHTPLLVRIKVEMAIVSKFLTKKHNLLAVPNILSNKHNMFNHVLTQASDCWEVSSFSLYHISQIWARCKGVGRITHPGSTQYQNGCYFRNVLHAQRADRYLKKCSRNCELQSPPGEGSRKCQVFTSQKPSNCIEAHFSATKPRACDCAITWKQQMLLDLAG